MNYKSYSNLSIDILNGIHKVPVSIQLVVGIPRSGMVPAYMIGAQLNLPVISLDEYLSGNYGSIGERLTRIDLKSITEILVVDDSIYSGKAITKAKDRLNEKNFKGQYYFCAIYSATKNNLLLDFYFNYLPQPRVFQWNYKNHFIATKSCYDIDGVLCVDPTDNENDDGANYRQFISSTKPLFIPNYKISCLVTSRLEKYRPETESWLYKHDVNYEELIMLDLPSAKKRRELKIHAKFKAEVFSNRSEEYFVESNWEQAKVIFKLTNKPVFCVQNDVFIKTYTDIVYYENAKKYSNRFLNDVFSDVSELGSKFQQLKMNFDDLEIKNQTLQYKIKKIETNKWILFSKLNFKQKFFFIIDLGLHKIKKFT